MRAASAMVQAARFRGSTSRWAALVLCSKSSPHHWVVRASRLARVLESPTALKRLRSTATLPQDVSAVPSRVPERCELTKGPGAPDRTTRMEEENPALAAGFRCAHRLDAVLLRQGRARA